MTLKRCGLHSSAKRAHCTLSRAICSDLKHELVQPRKDQSRVASRIAPALFSVVIGLVTDRFVSERESRFSAANGKGGIAVCLAGIGCSVDCHSAPGEVAARTADPGCGLD